MYDHLNFIYSIKSILKQDPMSFQNSYGPDGSININVVPSFGRIVQLPENQKNSTVLYILFKLSEVDVWRTRKGAVHQRPADFDPSRYVSFSTKEVVEEPVAQEHIHEYVERSRLSRRLGW